MNIKFANKLLRSANKLFGVSDEFEALLKNISYETFLSDRLNIKSAELEQVRTAFGTRSVHLLELESLLNNAGCGKIVFDCGNIIYPVADRHSDSFPVYFDVVTDEQKLRIVIEMLNAGLALTDIRRFVILSESLEWHSPVKMRVVHRKKNSVLRFALAGALCFGGGAAFFGLPYPFLSLIAAVLLCSVFGAAVGIVAGALRLKSSGSARERGLAAYCAKNLQHPIDFYIKFADNGQPRGSAFGKALSFERLDTEKL